MSIAGILMAGSPAARLAGLVEELRAALLAEHHLR
jgi:hypothetical protein